MVMVMRMGSVIMRMRMRGSARGVRVVDALVRDKGADICAR